MAGDRITDMPDAGALGGLSSEAVVPIVYPDSESGRNYRFRLKEAFNLTVSFVALALSTGAGLVGFAQSGAGAATRTVQDRLRDRVSALDYIPSEFHATIRARTCETDLADYIQAACDAIAARSPFGGELHFPAGRYRCDSDVTIPLYFTASGEGQAASMIEWTHTGYGFKSVNPINDSTFVQVIIEKLWLKNANALNTGALFYDTGGTEIVIRNCTIQGSKYGVILDQSELVDIYECDITAQLYGGVWLVNGDDLTPGAQSGYTNRISITHCDLNANGTFGILDDGGYCHTFTDNNYNGSTYHIRAAGVVGFQVLGGEFEAAVTSSILLAATSASGDAVGQIGAALIQGCGLFPGGNDSSITISSVGLLTLIGNTFGNTGNAAVPLVAGMSNCSAIYTAGNFAGGSVGPFLSGPASNLTTVEEGLREGSATWNPPSVANAASTTTTVTVSGAAVGDRVECVTFSNSLAGGFMTGFVSAANTVTVVLNNLSGGAIDLASGTVSVRVMKQYV